MDGLGGRGLIDVVGNGHQVRILLADAHVLVRDALKNVLEHQGDLEVVEEADDGVGAVTAAERARPDVALLDANLPNRDGVAAASLIKERVPGCRVVVIGDEEDPAVLQRAVEAGASGFLSRRSPLTELLEATRAASMGETLVPRRMLGELLERLVERRRDYDEVLDRIGRLSAREREVLALLADGGDNQSIAGELVISPLTARTHIQNVIRKLEVHSRVEAASLVIQHAIRDELVGLGGPGRSVRIPDSGSPDPEAGQPNLRVV